MSCWIKGKGRSRLGSSPTLLCNVCSLLDAVELQAWPILPHTHRCDRATLAFPTIMECSELEGTHRNIESSCWPLLSAQAELPGQSCGRGCPRRVLHSRGGSSSSGSFPAPRRAEPPTAPNAHRDCCCCCCCGDGFYSSLPQTASMWGVQAEMCLQLPAQATSLPRRGTEVSPPGQWPPVTLPWAWLSSITCQTQPCWSLQLFATQM